MFLLTFLLGFWTVLVTAVISEVSGGFYLLLCFFVSFFFFSKALALHTYYRLPEITFSKREATFFSEE